MHFERWIEENQERFLFQKTSYKLSILLKIIQTKGSLQEQKQLNDLLTKSSFIKALFNQSTFKQKQRIASSRFNYLTNDDMMRVFGVSRRILAKWRAMKLVDYEVVGNRYYYPISSILNQLKNNYIHNS